MFIIYYHTFQWVLIILLQLEIIKGKMPKLNSLNVDYRKVLKGVNNHMLVGQVKKVNKATNERTVACVKLSLDPKLLKYFNAR